jgi:hypothetical protein
MCFAWVQSAAAQEEAQNMEVQVDSLHLRWDPPGPAYEDKSLPAKIGCNIRDGFVGVFDSLCQGLFSGVAILSPWGGFTAKKVVTIVGDVVGLVDNNIATQYVFNGVLSRQLLRFGAGNTVIVNGLGVIHDTEYDGPQLPLEVYVDDRYFHHEAYYTPSALVMIGGVVVSDILIRPVGNLIVVFGARETGEAIDDFGVRLVGKSTKPKFF